MASLHRRRSNQKSKKAKPVAKPPMKSRKRARKITTLFHKYTRERDEAEKQGNSKAVQDWERKIQEIGGREEYQRASQLNTSFHSTSKWVLKHLSKQQNWLDSGVVDNEGDDNEKDNSKVLRRKVRLLEVGAINTELLQAANKRQYLHVRAIDLRSSHELIEEIDFFQLEYLHADPDKRYDTIVCSMVLNCISTSEQRGNMLFILKDHLIPGSGLLFLTIPLLCLTQSPYITKDTFLDMLGSEGVGFEIIETKETPKIAFFILRRPTSKNKISFGFSGGGVYSGTADEINPRWSKMVVVRQGKKFRNTFAVILTEPGKRRLSHRDVGNV